MAVLKWALVVLCVGCVETEFEPIRLVDQGTGIETCAEAAHYVVKDCEVFGDDQLIPLTNACTAGEDEPWTRCARQTPTPKCLDLHFCAEAVADMGNGGGAGFDQGIGCMTDVDCSNGTFCENQCCVFD